MQDCDFVFAGYNPSHVNASFFLHGEDCKEKLANISLFTRISFPLQKLASVRGSSKCMVYIIYMSKFTYCIFAVIGRTTINNPEILQVFMVF